MKDGEFSAFATVPDALLVVGRDGSIAYANEHAERLFGYEKGTLAGITVETLVPERFRERHVVLRTEYASSPDVRPMAAGREFWALRADGTELPVEIALGPGSHRERHVVVLVRDLTTVAKTRNDLRRSEQRFRTAAEATADLIWEANEPSDSLVWHGDIDTMLGYAPGEVPRTISGWLGLIHPDDREAVERAVERSIVTGKYHCPDYRIRRKDGTHLFWEDRGAVIEVVDGRATRAVGVTTDITERVRARQDLERAMAELAALKDRLKAESEYLQAEIKSEHNFDDIVGNSTAILATLHKVDQVAGTDSTVLLFGETGTGKELLARAVHSRSRRKARPLIKIDCSTLPAGLIESELFGHEKGAFTGAHESKAGRFELADGGTVFLDEVGELPLDLQSKLLRVLEEGRFSRLGAKREHQVDVRVIAATNRDLRTEVREGRFRADLYYRLGVFLIESPPLRDRREDILLLISFFVSKFGLALGKTINSVAKESMDRLVAYDWPGNVRELQNVIERSVILSVGGKLQVEETLGSLEASHDMRPATLKQDLHAVERANILRALEESGWKVKGEGNAASRLGLKPSTLRFRMRRLGIERPH
jgi:PAS domain S-box-containing protein